MIGLFTEGSGSVKLEARSSLPSSGDKNRHYQTECTQHLQPGSLSHSPSLVLKWTHDKLPMYYGTL